jgi:hypothetical protein
MGLSLRGQTSGAVDINAPDVAGDNTITLPGGNGSANQFYKNSDTAGIITHSSMTESSSGVISIGDIDINGTTRTITTGVGQTVGFSTDIEVQGSVSISSGNLVLASGNGIDFSATADGSGTMNNELFDDYEEGIWQPKFFNDQNGATTVSTGSRAAKYVKIGRTVYISCYIQCSSKGTNTGGVSVDNLPYASDTNGQLHYGIAVGFFSGLTSNHSTLYATVQPNTNWLLLRKVAGTADISVSSVVASDITNGFDLILGGSYITAD